MNEEQIKKLFQWCVRELDEWDLVHGIAEDDQLKEFINNLVLAAHAAGLDPNDLKSLDFLKDGGKYQIRAVCLTSNSNGKYTAQNSTRSKHGEG